MIGSRLRRLPRVLAVLGSTLLVSGIVAHGAAANEATFAHSTGQIKRERVVRFSDLDLSREADAETLYRRIRAAARRVCRGSGILAGMPSSQTRACTDDATARAIVMVNEPTLSRVQK